MKAFKRFEQNTKIIMVARSLGEWLFIIFVLFLTILPLYFRLAVAAFMFLSLSLGWILAFTGFTDDMRYKNVTFYLEQVFTVFVFMAMAYLIWPYLGFAFMFAIFPTIVAVSMVARFKKGLIISSFYVIGYILLYFMLNNKPAPLPYFFVVPIIISVSVSTALLTKEIERLAITDNLTSLYNQRYFKQQLAQMVNSNRKQDNFALLLVDIDNFKRFNDTFGHLEGDRILKTTANFMTKPLRKTDILARYGGEEFIAILPNTDLKGAKIVAEKIRKTVAESTDVPKITVSIGVSEFPKNGRSQEEILKSADMAMYNAKKRGKNKVCLAT